MGDVGMTDTDPLDRAEVMFALSHHQPLTARGVSDMLGCDANAASNMLGRLYHDGLLVRRQRQQSGVHGPDPHEYAIGGVDDWQHATDGGEADGAQNEP